MPLDTYTPYYCYFLLSRIYGTLPHPVKSGQSTYKNQPGRIENYVTGHSSVSEKESKEVSENFNYENIVIISFQILTVSHLAFFILINS